MVNKRGKLKSKKAEIFGMSFGMIFSIILIVFFIAVAFIGIRYFLSWQKGVNTNLFVEDLRTKVNEAWNAEKTTLTFNKALPITADYMCFIDFAKNPIDASNIGSGIYDNIRHTSYQADKNLYFYIANPISIVRSDSISHIDLSKKNPVCFKVINNKVLIKIEKTADSALVELK